MINMKSMRMKSDLSFCIVQSFAAIVFSSLHARSVEHAYRSGRRYRETSFNFKARYRAPQHLYNPVPGYCTGASGDNDMMIRAWLLMGAPMGVLMGVRSCVRVRVRMRVRLVQRVTKALWRVQNLIA